jgi:hypothetical protein
MIGGGGGGGYYGGGGGAGACIVAIGHTLPAGVCNVIVGDGGASNSSTNVDAGRGGDSSISVGETTLYLAKGGGSGGNGWANGNPGGCGGGAGIGTIGMVSSRSGGNDVSTNIVNGVPNLGPTIPIQPTYAIFGNKGGDQLDNTNNLSRYSSPGGGGIGAAGGNHAAGNMAAGPGGAGLNGARINDITYNFKSYFANNNPFGHNNNGFIGGGGSGKTYSNLTQDPGGIGGGGNGSAGQGISAASTINATPGAANTGSGGGGGYGVDTSGGSGIVIIRYRS